MEQSEILKHFTPHLMELLSPERYTHSVAVANRAVALAKLYHEDEEKAYTAGLLHDIMKDAEAKTQLQLLEKFGIILDREQMKTPKVWHSFASAIYVKELLHISDKDVFNGIYYHTTGRADMSRFEMILCLADKTSSDRIYKGVEELRTLSEQNLEKAMKHMLSASVERLKAEGKTVNPYSDGAYCYFCKRGEACAE